MERFTAENEARKTLAQILGGVAVLLSLCVAWGTLEVGREGQITDRFTKAIAQLGEGGKDDLTVRLGGIYALERIARDSERDHWPVMEVLTTYVRDPTPWLSQDLRPLKDGPACMEELPTPSEFRLATDIQAVLTVLGRRTHTHKKGDKQRLNLMNADLRTADLREARLQGANLYKARLEGAYLQDAQLQDTYLRGAQLQRACLQRVQLQGAHLRDAQLQRADLRGARLQGAGLQDAQLQGADLRGAQLDRACLAKAQLQGVQFSGVEQLLTVKTLYGADLDPLLWEQIHQRDSSLLDKQPPNLDDLCAE